MSRKSEAIVTKRKAPIASISINHFARFEDTFIKQNTIGWEHYDIEGHRNIVQAVHWAIEAFYEEYNSDYQITTIGRRWQTNGNHNLEYCMNTSYLRSPSDLKMIKFYEKARRNATGKKGVK
jgi:hypothetical protein